MSHLPELPDFGVRNMVKPGIEPSEVVLHGHEGNPLDVMDEIEPMLRPLPEIGEIMTRMHLLLLNQLKLPKEETWSSQEGLRTIHEMWKEYLEGTAASAAEAQRRVRQVDQRVWPRFEPMLMENPGLAMWSAMFVRRSLFSAMFCLRVRERKLAAAMVAAHCVDWNIFGDIGRIPLLDGSFLSCVGDECFIFARDRCRYAQKYLKGAQNVLYLGGGCDPTLWTHGYRIPEDQRITICDPEDYRAQLMQLVGPEQFGHIDYRCEQMVTMLDDPREFGKYDLVIASGLMSYYRNILGSVMMDVAKVLKPGGRFVFDLQVKHLTYLYVAKVHNWPGGSMVLEESPEAAHEGVRKLCQETDLVLEDWYHNPECPAGACFTLGIL